EVERLLREYTQNQEMVRNIGSHYYQIIYPVQLRQHKKMGISTREIGSSKVRKARSTAETWRILRSELQVPVISCNISQDSFINRPIRFISLRPREICVKRMHK
ncbi:hypothetical protein BDFB_013320, partial [Asbolus verrucosus]